MKKPISVTGSMNQTNFKSKNGSLFWPSRFPNAKMPVIQQWDMGDWSVILRDDGSETGIFEVKTPYWTIHHGLVLALIVRPGVDNSQLSDQNVIWHGDYFDIHELGHPGAGHLTVVLHKTTFMLPNN